MSRRCSARWNVAIRMLACVLFLLHVPARAQETSERDEEDTSEAQTGWEFAGVPALSYDADDGFGYGAIVAMYDYGEGTVDPYRLTIQPRIVRTTGGRRDYLVFMDGPHIPGEKWRTTVYASYERELTAPYYGMGNETSYDPSRAEGDNQYFYRFGMLRRQFSFQMQRALAGSPLKALGAVRFSYVKTNPTPHGQDSTLLSRDRTADESAWTNSLQVGLVWDTRNRETGPRTGAWSELLIRRVDDLLGSSSDYTRWTLTDRRYYPVTDELTLANRILVQQVFGDAPFYDLYLVESSYKRQQGLGGAKSIRGLFKNRYVGKGMLIWNAELRWRVFDLRLWNRTFYAVLSGFVDSGRVWENRLVLPDFASNLHHGAGGGLRVGMGENFIVGLDVGYGSEAGIRLYTGTGYMF